MESRRKVMRILRTMFTTGLAYVVNYGITLVLTPYITDTVGTEAYGFVSLAKQFAQYAVIITMALNAFAARYIGIAYHNNEMKEANVYFSSIFWGDVAVGSIILSIAIVCITFLERLVHIPSAIVSDIKILFLFIFIAFWISTVFSVFGCASYIRNKRDVAGVFKTISYMTNAVVLIVTYVLFPAKVFYVGLGTAAAALVVALADYWITKRYTPEFNTNRANFSLKAVKSVVTEGCWASFMSMGDLLNNGLDLIVCNQMLSSLAMGQLSIAKTMNMIVQDLYLITDQAFHPLFLKSYAENNRGRLLEELKLSMKVSGLLANLTFAGFVALGMAYYRLWIPNQDLPLVYTLTIVTIATCVPSGAIHPLNYIYIMTLKNQVPCFIYITGGLFNVVGMYVLIKYFGMGIYAVAWTTVVVMTVLNFVTNPIYMAHVLDLPHWTFHPDIFLNVLSCGVLVGIFKGLSMLYMPSSWVTLILCAVVYAIVGLPVHFLIVCNKQQRGALLDILRKRRRIA